MSFQSRLKKPSTTDSTALVPNASKKTVSGLVLPTAPNEPPPNLWDYSWFFYGEKNWGKSTVAAKFPDVKAHFMFQVNRNDIRTPIIPQKGEEPLNWNRFQEYLQLLIDKHKEPGRAVVDDLDLCARACQKYHATKAGQPSMMNLNDQGRGWDVMKTDWENTWSNFFFAGWRVTLTSHARVRPRVVRGIARDDMKKALADEVILPETQPTATGWAYEWSKVVAAFVGYGGYMQNRRVLHIRGNQRLHASAGGLADEHFLQKKGCHRAGEPYDYFYTGNSPDEAFKNLKLAWDNKLEGHFTETEESFAIEE